ncbi:D-(-)-3-hydroxybutyrate oligomer hydrolase [Cupriavidus pinatubonensis]|uniref:D-(-)-3-hydroxybutyrate oligomer hydrolase n=1 Tax=Cupriavidus pinatubonensis TaxID=248026 RepID=A0ABM8WJ10_9BURK|nr:D-(-)-3-hydroxybutyrate oligomer hydrolase [Cupriavidus pinatubonensis]CAG9167162.1 D-(-)-3-hydroxybutyrate oligomer hydrolase [Cupriavidus pinatubonensis]
MHHDNFRRLGNAAFAAAAALLAVACGGGDSSDGNTNPNIKPANIGTVTIQAYDGATDDLLTAGLGKDGLASATAPVPASPNSPTAAELRRYAIYTNYRAIVDTTAGGGFGSLYGPNVDAQGNVTTGQGKIAGVEYLAFSDDGSGQENVTMLVQIPNTFNQSKPCMITATSSGSRGVYGAIAVGEWGLKRGCAVAYTDKGTGAAPHDLDTDTVPLIDGTRTTRSAAGTNAQFAARPGILSFADFTAQAPHRLAFKHAHSQRNPEKDWGKFTLQAIEFGIWAINDRFGTVASNGVRQRTLAKSKIVVIASSVSNGGGAAVAAAEQDTDGLIDGVAVAEPNLNLPPNASILVKRGSKPVNASGRLLYDYITTANLLQLCASQATALVNAPAFATNQFYISRCQTLVDNKLISGTTVSDQAASALDQLHLAGWEPESDALHPSLSLFDTAASIAVTYANSYARASVTDRLCGYSFAATLADFKPAAIAPSVLASMFATGNGVPPTSTVQLINDRDLQHGPFLNGQSVSASNNRADANFDGAKCLRDLLTGTDSQAQALQSGVSQIQRSGNLRGKPALIVHGRSDGLLPVNHTSRPYLGFNRQQEGAASKLSYIEVENAQHFDAFIGVVSGYSNRYVPLHLYLIRALDAVYDNLTTGKALPPSQVVRTIPRGGATNTTTAPTLLPANVPPISASPDAANQIAASTGSVDVPD